MNKKYSIDTSSLIDMMSTYPLDVFPSLWNKLDSLIQTQTLLISDEVFDELKRKEDILYEWAKQRSNMLYISNGLVQDQVTEIVNKFQGLVDIESDKSRADPYVIAIARITHGTVITHERMRRNQQKPHIPNVCRNYSIPCIRNLDFFREQGWHFELVPGGPAGVS